jgi:hypothetical protein
MIYEIKPRKFRVWKTKSGKKMKIKDMESSHIRNCISLLDRAKINQERNFQMICDFFDLDLEPDDSPPVVLGILDEYILVFKDELKRRQV